MARGKRAKISCAKRHASSARTGSVSPITIYVQSAWIRARLSFAFRGEPNQDLGNLEIDGREAHGFEIDLPKFDADIASPGKVRVWVDNETKRVAHVVFELLMLERRHIMTFDQFVWNEPSDDWFSVTPPEGYANLTPVPEKLDAAELAAWTSVSRVIINLSETITRS